MGNITARAHAGPFTGSSSIDRPSGEGRVVEVRIGSGLTVEVEGGLGDAVIVSTAGQIADLFAGLRDAAMARIRETACEACLGGTPTTVARHRHTCLARPAAAPAGVLFAGSVTDFLDAVAAASRGNVS